MNYQPKGGTKVAFDYAIQKKRCGKDLTIINLYVIDDETQEKGDLSN